jgi:hypothetical protein
MGIRPAPLSRSRCQHDRRHRREGSRTEALVSEFVAEVRRRHTIPV